MAELSDRLLTVEGCQSTSGSKSKCLRFDPPRDSGPEQEQAVSEGKLGAVVLVVLEQVAQSLSGTFHRPLWPSGTEWKAWDEMVSSAVFDHQVDTASQEVRLRQPRLGLDRHWELHRVQFMNVVFTGGYFQWDDLHILARVQKSLLAVHCCKRA